MTLVDWWVRAPEFVSPKIPSLLKALLVPWIVIGLAIAFIPELQQMPDIIRAIFGFPLVIGMLWLAFGLFLSIGDKLLAFASFVKRHFKSAD